MFGTNNLLQKLRRGVFLVCIVSMLILSNLYFLSNGKQSTNEIDIKNENGMLTALHIDPTVEILSETSDSEINGESKYHPSEELSQSKEIRKFSLEGFNANFSTNTKTLENGFRYEYEENYEDNTTHVQKPNNYDISLSPFSPNYSDFNVTMNVDTYSPETIYIFEDDINKQEPIDSNEYFAQGIPLPQLIYGATFTFQSFNVSVVTSDNNNQTYIGQLWNADYSTSDSQIVPGILLASASYDAIATQTTNFRFNFSNPVSVNETQTYNDTSAGYVFFLIFPQNIGSGSTKWELDWSDHGVDAVDDGITYSARSGGTPATLPSNKNDWPAPKAQDLALAYNASVIFDPSLIDTKVNSMTVDSSGGYIDPISQDKTTDYLISFNETKTGIVQTLLNVSYIKYQANSKTVSPIFKTSPLSSLTNWTISLGSELYTELYFHAQRILIPETFILESILRSSIPLSQGTEYLINPTGGANNTISLLTGTGNYDLNANTLNLLENATLKTYVSNGGWQEQNNGSMGILFPTIIKGDRVNATITNILDLNLNGGKINSTFRNPIQQIPQNNSFGGYIDGWLNEFEENFVGSASFSTYIDPNEKVGVWAFEFIWYNDTAAGSTGIEFYVIPVTILDLIEPAPTLSILEGDVVNFQVSTLDQSHNSNWPDSAQLISELANKSLSYESYLVSENRYIHSTILNTSIFSVNLLHPGNYSFEIQFTNVDYTHSVFIQLEIFYRAATTLIGTDTINYGQNLTFTFQGLNLTDGGTILNSSSIIFGSLETFETLYNPTTGEYSIKIIWSSNYSVGVNTFALDWKFGSYRENSSDPWMRKSFDFTVIDPLSPIFLQITVDYNYAEGTTGHDLNWNVSDANPNNYQIYQNGSSATDGSDLWDVDNNITYSIDGLTKGVYNITIQVFDTSGNFATDEVLVFVFDNTKPAFTQFPSNFSIIEGTFGNKISWKATDNDPNFGNFSVYKDGVLYPGGTGQWTSNLQQNIPIDGLIIGIYNFTVIISDYSNNQELRSVLVTVLDNNNPIFALQPSNLIYPLGTDSNILEWIATDPHPSTYTLYDNDSLVYTDKFSVTHNNLPWISSSPISINVDNLALGAYNFTIVITDSSGNQVSDTVFVFVIDNPVFTSIPNDFSYTNDTSGNTLSWSLTSSTPDYYIIYRNGSIVKNGTWSTGVAITINIDNLLVNYYNFTIFVNDTNGKFNLDEVFVLVTDIPNINLPIDISYNEFETNNIISWIPTDSLPYNYTVYINGIFRENGTWTSGVPIPVNLDGLYKGVFDVEIIIMDQNGNTKNDHVIVTVNDVTAPDVTSPSDISYSEGQNGNQIVWTVGDRYPELYNITNNGSIYNGFENISWVNNTVAVNVDGLLKGTHVFNITVSDESANLSFDVVIIIVLDATSPDIDSPIDIYYSEGNTGNDIVWTIGDRYPGLYNVTKDGGIYNATTIWSNGTIIINVDGLTKGTYLFNITIFDLSNNAIFDIVIVTVDFTPPDVERPDDIFFSEVSLGNNITWTIGDTFPGVYNVTNNGSIYNSLENMSWVNGTILVNVDGLLKGTHVFNITIIDESGNLSFDVVNVNVIDTTFPDIDSPTDLYYSEINLGNNITWTVGDRYTGVYNVTKDGGIYNSTALWSNGTIIVNVDGLAKGTYLFNITIFDLSNNAVFDIVIVTVDFTPPDVDSPDDLVYGIGNLGNSIVWTLGDRYPGLYNVTKNGAIYNSTNSWANGSININVDGLDIGTYVFNISVYDDSGNPAFDVVTVLVTDDTPPNVDSPADIIYSEGELGNSIVWTVNDLSPGVFNVTKDGVIYNSTNTWLNGMLIINVDTLLKGIYIFNITVYDATGSAAFDIVLVTVTDVVSPNVSTPSNTTIEQFQENQFVNWNASENYPDHYDVYIDESLDSTGSWNGSEIFYLIDTSILGLHNYTIIIYDTSGNWGSDTVYINVIDTVQPLINSLPNYIFEEGEAGNSIIWSSYDFNHRNYSVYLDNFPRDSNILGSVNSSIIIFISSLLSPGIYNYTITIEDTSGNIAFDTILVVIQDTTLPIISDSPNSNILYIEQSISNNIKWTVNEKHPAYYTLYQNDTIIGNTTWIDDFEIVININGLNKGVYNFTIVIYDQSLNFITDIIIVDVIDESEPVITDIIFDEVYVENVTNNTIRWQVTDLYPSFFELYANGTLAVSGNWNNTSDVTININSLVRGFHNFTIFIFDSSNNNVTNSIVFYILDIEAPTVLMAPDDIIFKQNETGKRLIWNATDPHPEDYLILINGIESTYQGFWNNSGLIEINIDHLPIGEYNFTLIIRDDTGNIQTDKVKVTVKDPNIIETHNPILLPEPKVFEGDVDILEGIWLVKDNTSEITNGRIFITLSQDKIGIQTSEFETTSNGTFSIWINYSDLFAGFYELEIQFEKAGFESQIQTFEIEILASPLVIEVIVPKILTPNKVYSISARVSYEYENNTEILDGLGLNVVGNRTNRRAEGVILIFSITYLSINQETIQLFKESMTDLNGIASIFLSKFETKSILEILSIEVKLKDQSNFSALISQVSSQQLPEITDPELEFIEIAQNYLRSNYIILLIIIVLLILAYLILNKIKKRKIQKIQKIMRESLTSEVEINSYLSMKAFIIKNKHGIPVYEEKFKELTADMALIAGLTSAVSSFLNEVDKDLMFGFETMEREGISLTSHEAQYSTFTTISDEELPLTLMNLIKNAHILIETEYPDKSVDAGFQLEPSLVNWGLDAAGLLFSLLRGVKINRKNLWKIKNEISVNKHLKDNLFLLDEISRNQEEKGGLVKLNEIMDHLTFNGLSKENSSRLVVIANDFGVFYSE